MSNSVVPDPWLTAQRGVLGSVLIDGKCADLMLSDTRPEDYTDVYRELYLIVQELVRTGQVVDPIVVLNGLGRRDGSGRALIAELIDLTPTSRHCREYIEIVVEQSRLHRVRTLSLELMDCKSTEEAQELTGKLSELLAARTKQEVYNMPRLLEQFYERHSAAKSPVDYLPWGLGALDRMMFVEPGDFVVLGGYPSDGKTALAISFAWRQCESWRVGFFSLETRPEKLFDRQVSMVTGIPLPDIKRNQLGEAEWTRMAQDGRTIYKRSLELIPAAGMSAAEVMMYAKARGYQVVYIDYIQLLRPDNPRASRYEAVSQMSMVLHTLANQYRITVVGLSQLRRPERDRRREAPNMSDLRESGQLEQDADAVLLLYRDCPNNPAVPDRTLKIAKNKEGAAREVIALRFEGATQRFSLRPDNRPLKQRVEAAQA